MSIQDDGLRPLGLLPTKGGADQKEKGYFINTACTRRVGGILVLLSVALVIVGLTSSAHIAQQQRVVQLKEGMLHQGQIRDGGGLQQHHAKLVKTLTMMQGYMSHEGDKQRKLKRAVRRFADVHKQYTGIFVKLVAQIDGATAKQDMEGAGAAFAQLKEQLLAMNKSFRATEKDMLKVTAFAVQHDKRRASRMDTLQARVAEELQGVIAAERSAEIAEASHAAADPQFAADLSDAEEANAAMLESGDQAELGQTIFSFKHYVEHMRLPTLSAAELAAAQALLEDLHGSKIAVKDAEVKMEQIASQEDLRPRGPEDDRSLIERFERLVDKALFAPQRPAMLARLAKWQRHELSDTEMLLFVQQTAPELIPDELEKHGGEEEEAAPGEVGGFQRRQRDAHVGQRRQARVTKLLEHRKRLQACMAVHGAGDAFAGTQATMCAALGITAATTSEAMASMTMCLGLTDPATVVANGGEPHEWTKEEKTECGSVGLGPDAAEELTWCLTLARDASTTWSEGVRKVCARYAIGPTENDRDQYF
jgi:hypothetical protein